MAKRPREIERPGEGLDALNNPHKRVLLSYDDIDDEDVQDAAAATMTGPDADAHLANYQMDTYSPEPLEKVAHIGAERPGKAIGASQENGASREGNKPLATATATAAQEPSRGTKQEVGGSHTHTSADASGPLRADIRRDRRTNQFPVLGLPSADEEYAEAYDDEATAYVMRARAEIASIPQILSGPQPVPAETADGAYEDEDADYYEDDPNPFYDNDDAFVGSPEEGAPQNDDTDPRSLYTRAIRDRFLEQRKLLSIPPSANSLAALGDGCPISFLKGNNKSVAEWHRILTCKVPQPAQVRAFDQDTVFGLLELIQRFFLLKNRNIKSKTSAWIWSLLAKLDDVGNMDNDQVYLVRSFAQQSILCSIHMDNPEGAAFLEIARQTEEEQLPELLASVSNPNEIDLEDRPKSSSSKASSKGSTASDKKKQKKQKKQNTPGILPQDQYTDNTKATLEMIVAVVGEVFRQRDILEARLPWEKPTTEQKES